MLLTTKQKENPMESEEKEYQCEACDVQLDNDDVEADFTLNNDGQAEMRGLLCRNCHAIVQAFRAVLSALPCCPVSYVLNDVSHFQWSKETGNQLLEQGEYICDECYATPLAKKDVVH